MLNITNTSEGNFTNVTTTVAQPPHMDHALYVLPLVATYVLLIANSWIVVSLTHYGIIQHRRQSCASEKNNLDKLNHGVIFATVVVCSVLCELRLVFTIVELKISQNHSSTKVLCEVVSDISYNLFNLAFFASFMVFWLRQRVFYNNKMLAVSYGKALGCLSKYSIILVLLPGIVGTIVHTWLPSFTRSDFGCAHTHVFEKPEHIFAVVVITITCTVGQMILVGLFVYPLRMRLRHAVLMTVSRRYRSKSRRSVQSVSSVTTQVQDISNCDVPTPTHAKVEWRPSKPKQRSVSTSFSRRAALHQKIKTIMIRSTIALVVSILAQVLIAWLTQHTAHDVGFRRIGIVVSDIVLFVHILYIICTFASYKKMLTSPFNSCQCPKFGTYV